jgi:RHS repeat-associated protein
VNKVNNVSSYVYDGEGQRVRKLVNENLRFIYGIGGHLVSEFSGATGALQKEYVYGASGLVATIEPNTVNGNGTRYITSDHLGSPRVATSSSAAVVSRHDYMPFGGEIGAGIGGRTTGMGYTALADGLRQKFTSKERDSETGLDYFGSRYSSSMQGRFTTADSWAGKVVNPQSLNRYSYVVNNPLKYIDLWGHQGELPKKRGKRGDGEEEIPADRENNTDDGECPCPVYVTHVAGNQYVPNNRQIYDDWFDVLRGRLSFLSYMRNAGAFLDQSERDGDAAAEMITRNFNEAINEPEVQLFAGMTARGPLKLVGAEEAASVRVGRWMSRLELDTMLESGFVQLSRNLGVTNVAYPAGATAFIKQAEVGSVYVEFNVARSSVVSKGGGWGLIPGPNSIYATMATRRGQPVPQMPRATNIEHKATKIRN